MLVNVEIVKKHDHCNIKGESLVTNVPHPQIFAHSHSLPPTIKPAILKAIVTFMFQIDRARCTCQGFDRIYL
jgi:hypothetical protein